MSGFEVIGVVLGGLPLVIKAAHDYREGFEPILKWMKFKNEFRVFINNVDVEKQMFDAAVDRLLLYTDLPAEQKENLLVGKDPEGWRSTGVQKALRRRLGDSCQACLHLLESIETDFTKLEAMMSLKDGSVDWANPGEDKYHYQRKRISHSFSNKGSRTIASLGEKTEKLNKLLAGLDLKRTENQSNHRNLATRDTRWARIFECIRHQACSLHLALRNGWKCSCEIPHLAALQLQQRATGDWSSEFIMAFGQPNDNQKSTTSQRKLAVTVKQSNISSPEISTRPQPTPLQENLSKINLLRANFENGSSSGKMDKDLHMNTSSSSLSVPSSFGSVTTTVTKSAMSSTTVTPESSKHSFTGFFRGQKPKKTVRMSFALTAEVDACTKMPSHMPISASTETTSTEIALQEPETDIEIEDLCYALKTSDPYMPCLGYLPDNEHRHHQFRSLVDSKPPSTSQEFISLGKLLDKGSRPSLTRRDRYKLSLVLASSLLQLQTTPWLTGKLEKKDIFIECCDQTIETARPYIKHFFPSIKVPSPCPSDCGTLPATTGNERSATKSSLIHLGILLLELCFGQSIESHPERANNFTNGKPSDQTNFLTALDWICEVDAEAGPDFQTAINHCFTFDVKPNWNDVKFTQSIYAGVVQPLEKVLVDNGWAEKS